MGEPDTVELAATLLRERAHFLREGMPGAALGVDKNLHIHVQALIDLVTRLRSQGEREAVTVWREGPPVTVWVGSCKGTARTIISDNFERICAETFALWDGRGVVRKAELILSPPPSERG